MIRIVRVHRAHDVRIYGHRCLFDVANFVERVSSDQVSLFLDNHFEHLHRRLNLSTCVGVLMSHLLRDDHVLDQFHYELKYLFSSN